MLSVFYSRLLFRRLYILAILLIPSGITLAQLPDMDRKISLEYSDVRLEIILEKISEITGTKFSYSRDLIPVQQIITYSCNNKPLGKVLDDIFRQAGIQYALVNGYLVLKGVALPEEDLPVTRLRSYTISGSVSDSANNEFMIGAAIYTPEKGVGAVTNNYGFYSLTLPTGTYTIQTSFLGYSTQSRTIDLEADINLNIHLRQKPFAMKEIIINPVNKEEQVFHSLAAQTNIDPSVIQKRSAALGETDMLKSLDNLPGISFQSDGSSYFSVRGGGKDQNLVLLDDAPIFNPSHLLGLFTPIIPEAIKHTELYRADFPVQYGGRLSSVIDIRARDGNMLKFSGTASIGPVSTRFSLEGPLRKNFSSYFVSFRVSTFGLLVKAANPSVESFRFSDFTSKFNFRLGKRDRLFLTLFAGKDAFINKPGNVRNGLEWGNTAATLRWSHVYGSRLFSNTTLYASKYDYSLYTNYDSKVYWNSDISGANLKTEFTWFLNPGNDLKFGLNVSGYFFNPGNYISENAALDDQRVSQVNSGELVFYAGDELEITRWLKANFGFRFSNWSNYGEAFSVVYDDDYNPVTRTEYAKGVRYYSRNYIEPRLSLSLKTGKYNSVKASYNRNVQHINQINNSISPLNSLEVWIPSGPNLKPQYADILDLGFMQAWVKAGIELNADLYYKEMYNQTGYANHAELFLNPYLEGELRQGTGNAYGFEILLKKTAGRLTGQIGYAFSRSFLQINSMNNNRQFPSHQDRPNDVSFALDFRLRPRWTVNLNAVYTSGMAISTPTGFYYYRGKQVPLYDKLNNDRLPDYKRLDIGSIWRLNKMDKSFEHYFTLTIYNFFNTRNYAFLNFNKVQGADDKFYVPADNLNLQNQLPTYRYIYSVLPSFTYSLKF